MKKIKLPATVKDIERNYKNLSLDQFVVSLFDLEMNYWLYVELKNQFINLYGDQCTSNNTYQIICTLCEEHRKLEFDNFKKRIKSDIESYLSYSEKIEFLNKELNIIKSEWEKLVPEIYRSLNLINTYLPLGLDRKPQEPIIFYKQASEYLTTYINELEKDDLIERTPIINDLRASLGNFTFTEWAIKAEREAPKNLNERLTYFVSIRSDIQRWENDNQNGNKINFFDVTRYTSYDERGNAYGPMYNLLSFIDWCTLQIDLIKTNQLLNKKTTKPESYLNSFTYIHLQKKSSNLTNVYNSLKKHGLIEQCTTLGDFKKIFSGITDINQVIWTGNKAELSYFIKLIHNDLKLIESVKKAIWDVTIMCFKKSNGNSFSKIELRDAKKPSTYKIIETTASNF